MLNFPVQREAETLTGISFPGVDESNNQVACSISFEALQDHFGARSDYLNFFRQNRYSIEAAASEKHEQGGFEADGSVKLTTSDFS